MGFVNKLSNILNGWTNKISDTVGMSSERIKIQADARKSVCDSCEMNANNVCSTKEARHEITGEIVRGCGCPLSAKVFAEFDVCPLGKWNLMLNDKDFKIMYAASKHKKLCYLHYGNKPVLLYNTNNGFFTSIDSAIVIPYVAIPHHFENGKIQSANIVDGNAVLDYSFNSKILTFSEDFVKATKLHGQQTKPTLNIVWIPKTLCAELSTSAFRRACEFALADLYNKTQVSYQYIYTEKNNVSELIPYLDKLGIFYDMANISNTIKNQLIRHDN